MLSRDLCEKLAEAYPRDITMHALESFVFEGRHKPYSALPDDSEFWMIHLEDLLSIAHKCYPGRRFALVGPFNGGPKHRVQWGFASPSEPDIKPCFTATPEKAIALWLLDMANQRKEENP